MSLAEILLSFVSIVVLILVSGFFSGAETVITATSRSRLVQWDKSGNKNAKIVLTLLEGKQNIIGSLLIGNNFVNILASVLATNLFLYFFGEAGMMLTTLVMTVVVVIFAEVLPKVYALSNPDNIAVVVAPVVRGVYLLLKPINLTVIFICNLILKFFVPKGATVSTVDREEELRGAIELHHGEDPDYKHEREMLKSVMNLDDTNIEDAMTHRNMVTTLDVQHSVSTFVDSILNSSFSLFPATNGVENIIGVIDSKKFLCAHRLAHKEHKNFSAHQVLEKAWFVPKNTSMLVQLQAFRDRGDKIAIVVDEYGTYMGIITLTDILEYIVGNISQQDEPQQIKQESQNTFIVSGQELLRNINRELDWDIPDSHAKTIMGHILHEARFLPNEGQTFTFGRYRFVVLRRVRQKITKVRVSKIS